MPAADATAFPVKNQAYRFYFTFRDTTNKVLTGAPAGLSSTVYTDGVANGSVTVTSIGGAVYSADVSASQMNGSCVTVIINITNANFQDVYVERQLFPVDLTEIANNWADQSPKKLEQAILQVASLCLNRVVATGASMTVYGSNSSTPLLTGTYIENDTSSDRGKLD